MQGCIFCYFHFNSFLRSSFDLTPTILFTSFPSLNNIKVGIPITSYDWATSPSLSTFNFRNLISFISFDNSSNIGAIIRHGPHQEAQKSTMDFPLEISSLKLSEFTSLTILIPNKIQNLFYIKFSLTLLWCINLQNS